MFGFSLAKLVVATILILAVWYGFKVVNRVSEARSEVLPQRAKPRAEVEDLVECRRCGAFVSANAKACGRADCPYPR